MEEPLWTQSVNCVSSERLPGAENWALFRDVGEAQTSVCLVKVQRKTKLPPPPLDQLRFSSRAAYHLQPLAWSRLWLRACQGRARRDGHNEPIGEPLRRCVAPAPPGSLLLLAFQWTHGGSSCFHIETTAALFAVGGGARAYAVRLAAVKAPTRARPEAAQAAEEPARARPAAPAWTRVWARQPRPPRRDGPGHPCACGGRGRCYPGQLAASEGRGHDRTLAPVEGGDGACGGGTAGRRL